MFRYSVVAALLAVMCVALAGNVYAEDKATHEGTVVKTETGKLVMTDKDGKEHSHMIAADVKVTLDDKEAKLNDLEKGDKVEVTVNDGGKVVKIAAKRDAKK